MHVRSSASMRVVRVSALLVAVLLQACGGGGGGGGGGSGAGGSGGGTTVVTPVATTGYTKYCLAGDVVDASGNCNQGTLLGAANVWTCTRDNVTGLMWRRSSAVFDPVTSTPPSGTECGISGWRTPSVHELLSLTLPAKATAPQIDTDHFPGTPAAAFASAEPYQADPARRWAVDFNVGGGADAFGSGMLHVRWVAGSSRLSDPPEAKLVFGASRLDHDVLDDTARGLAWLIPRNPQPRTYDQAVAGAAVFNAEDLGYKGWRLPTREELDTLAVRTRQNPSLMPIVAQKSSLTLLTNTFWTSTALANFPGSVFGVNFEYGVIGPIDKQAQYGVLYVSRY